MKGWDFRGGIIGHGFLPWMSMIHEMVQQNIVVEQITQN